MALLAAAVSFKLQAHSPASARRKPAQDCQTRAERIQRLRASGIDQARVAEYVARFGRYSREQLIGEGFLSPAAPPKGSALLSGDHRTPAGAEL